MLSNVKSIVKFNKLLVSVLIVEYSEKKYYIMDILYIYIYISIKYVNLYIYIIIYIIINIMYIYIIMYKYIRKFFFHGIVYNKIISTNKQYIQSSMSLQYIVEHFG